MKRLLLAGLLTLTPAVVSAQQAVNVSKVNGVTPSTGNGASGTGTQRVTIANDSTGVLAGITTVTTVTGVTNVATIGTSVTPGTGAAHLGKAEDAAHSSGDTGVMALGVRRDTAAASSGTTGDYEPFSTDANGRVWTNIFGVTQAAATYLTVRLSDGSSFLTPGTDYTEDVASADAEAGPLMMSIRQDTPAGTTSADGDYQNLKTDSVGRLWINCGTGCSGGTQYTQDAALTVGTTVGTMAMGRASAAAPTDVSADGDAVMPWHLRSGAQVTQLSAAGALISATSTSLNVNCTGGCSGGTQYAEDTVAADANTVTMAGAVRRDSPVVGSGTDGDVSNLNVDSQGMLYVRAAQQSAWEVSLAAGTGSGASNHYTTSAASTNSTNVKASAGNIYDLSVVNTTATIYFLRLYNLASAPTCSSATGFIETIPVPASTTGAGIVRTFPVGRTYSTGIGFCLTGGGSSTDNTSAATGVYISIGYK